MSQKKTHMLKKPFTLLSVFALSLVAFFTGGRVDTHTATTVDQPEPDFSNLFSLSTPRASADSEPGDGCSCGDSGGGDSAGDTGGCGGDAGGPGADSGDGCGNGACSC